MASVRFKFTVNTVRAQSYLREIAEAWDHGAVQDFDKIFNEVKRLIDIELRLEDIPSEIECEMIGPALDTVDHPCD